MDVGTLSSTIKENAFANCTLANVSNQIIGYYDGSPVSTDWLKLQSTNKELSEDEVKEEIEAIEERLEELIDLIIKNKWMNKQWALDVADRLNELSVKY